MNATPKATAQQRLARLTPKQLRETSRAELRELVAAAQVENDAAQAPLNALAERREAANRANVDRAIRSAQERVRAEAYTKLYRVCMNNFTNRDLCLEMVAAYEMEFGESGLDDTLRRNWAKNDERAAANEAEFNRQLERARAIKQTEKDRQAAAAANLAEWDKTQTAVRAERDRVEAEKRDKRLRRKNAKAKEDIRRRYERADKTELAMELDIFEESDAEILSRIEVEFTAGFDALEKQLIHLRRGRSMYAILASRVLRRHWAAVFAYLEANPLARRRDGIEAVGGDPRTGSDATYSKARHYNDLATSRNRAAYIAGSEHRRQLRTKGQTR